MSEKRANVLRLEAIERYQAGKSATAICRSLGKSRQWLYKWLQRKEEIRSDSSLQRAHNRIPVEIEEAVVRTRKKLQKTKYAQIGVNSINRELHLHRISPLPATTIKRILRREGLQRKNAPYIPNVDKPHS